MSKIYTAQAMREMASREKFKCSFVTRTLNGGIILDCTSDVRTMLCQAANALEREKKYEYAVKYWHRNGGGYELEHFDTLETAKEVSSGSLKILRREVSEWEEVKE